jgi:ATP-dependent Clp protease adapter protein ClpS
MSALETPTIEQESETSEDLDLPWQVVVHNDPVNLMSYVTMVFQKVFGFTRERAEKHMLEVHARGVRSSGVACASVRNCTCSSCMVTCCSPPSSG